jgi:hypothetical protein
MLRALLLLAVVGCGQSAAEAPKPDVTVELAAVTLGDDCVPVPPPATKTPAKPAKPPASPAQPRAIPSPADCGGPNCGPVGQQCEQTSMQLAITTPAGFAATTVTIKRVELLDPKGKVLEVLSARVPQKWTPDGTYAAWDEKLGAGATVRAMYALTAPNWDKLTNGRWNAHTKTFQLRVTVAIGTASKTVEKQAITAARIPPAVPT